MRRAAVLGLCVGLLLAVLPSRAGAEIYRYTDERGQNHYVDGLENVPRAYRATATPLGLRNTPAAPASSAPAAAKPSGVAVIKYTPGQRIIVDAKINGSFTTKLLLDTGADRTLVSPRALAAAGVTITKPVASGNITGATGTDRIDYVVVESLEVGEARVDKLSVGSYELAGSGSGDGLLGRDFLDRFNMTIDATKGEVHLSPK
ncbi:MAG TPA: aspartyl protease family protein [Methylomirabilota bacterium]|nr:aspartyl protease family protein [Methylomirabilota bacterium]